MAAVEALLELGAPPNAQAQGGLMALHLAAKNGHVDIVKLLFQWERGP